MNKKIIGLGLLLASILTGCGYRIAGTGKLFPDNVKSIFIPEFNNITTTPAATSYITHAVVDKFIRRSGLKLVQNRSDADSLLEAKILGFQVTSLTQDETEDIRSFTIRISLALRFIDLTRNTVIFENQKFNFSHQYEFNSEDFFSQDKESQDKIAGKLAAKVVTAILENF